MADYSVTPLDLLLASRQKDYVGLHIEQGVPVLDRDLNLLHDLISATVREVVARYIGNGSPAGGDGFGVLALTPPDDPAQNFTISGGSGGPGRCLVGGVEVTIPAGGTTYGDQDGVPALTIPTAAQPDPRNDPVYLDVFLVEVDSTTDPDLANALDVGVQTSVRLKPSWVVRVAEGVAVPVAPPGHAFHVLAELARPRGQATITAAMITDRRQRGLTVSDVERRLRRVETALMPTFVTPAFTPQAGFPGATLAVNGTNFNIGTAVVRFGNVLAARTTVNSPTSISAGVPRGLATEGVAVRVPVSVENAAGRVVAGPLFSVLPAPAFAAPGSQFAPTSGGAGTPVTLHGENFTAGDPSVRFGTLTADIVGTPTARQLVARVPAGLVPAGSTSVTVKVEVTSGDAGPAVSDDDFTVTQAALPPAFPATGAQFTPQAGAPGDEVRLIGQNFDVAPATVAFGTVPATVLGTPTATQIRVQVPTGITPAGTSQAVSISVTTPGGTAVSTRQYTVSA